MADNQPAASTGDSVRNSVSVRSRALSCIPSTIEALNSPQAPMRREALAEAAHCFVAKEIPRPQETGWGNVLARTFYSYSMDGYSPSRLVWEAVIRGLSVIGCLDQDSLGALEEMFSAGDFLAIRAVVSLEVTVRVADYADRVVNRPGRIGSMQAIGAGFARVPKASDTQDGALSALPRRTRERNQAFIAKANVLLTPVTVDYVGDVLPLTPTGNVTERHIIASYLKKSETTFPDLDDRAVFWADVLGRAPHDVESLLSDHDTLLDLLIDKIPATLSLDAKESGDADLPDVSDFFRAVRTVGAVPCLSWREGVSEGESDPERLLDDALGWGAMAVAVQPDRVWNIADPKEKTARLAALERLVAAARRRNLPVLAGSKRDRPNQKLVDSLDAPELAPYVRDFTDSAFWLYGHTIMERALGNGVTGGWARMHFARDRAAANAFYLEVGKKAKPEAGTRQRLAEVGPDAAPGDVLNALG